MKEMLLGLFTFFLFFSPVLAQNLEEVAVTDDSNLKTDMIWQRERLDAEIATVKTTYQSQLENYLYQEKLYKIAYDQNKELQTLASIEDLTQKAKALGLSRDEVLISYLDLLRLNLLATEGIELSLKAKYLNKLETSLVYLKDHQENFKNVSNRDQVILFLGNFANDQKEVINLSQEVLVLLAIGNLQAIYDKSLVLKKDIDLFLENKGTLSLPNISRASDETTRSLSAAKLKLDAFWTEILNRNEGQYLGRFYSNLPNTLNPIYVNLSQSISYLNELLSL